MNSLLLAMLCLSLACNASEDRKSVPRIKRTVVPPLDDMVEVPDGWYRAGCAVVPASTDSYEMAACVQRNPPRDVWVSRFQIDRFETSQAAYAQCVEARVCAPPSRGDRTPADRQSPVLPVMVRHEQAVAYCSWRVARLPTEAEWEKAARGTDGRMFPWGNERPDCNSAAIDFDPLLDNGKTVLNCLRHVPGPIGQHPKDRSPAGAMDMAGNAPEWTSDLWIRNKGRWLDLTVQGRIEFADPAVIDPKGPSEARVAEEEFDARRPIYVFRGGVEDGAVGNRSSVVPFREAHEDGYGAPLAGIRCARSLPVVEPAPDLPATSVYSVSITPWRRSGPFEIRSKPLNDK